MQIEFKEQYAYLSNHGKWAIFYNEDNQNAGKVAYQMYYRSEKHAIRGAERLHRREHGAFEEAILGIKK